MIRTAVLLALFVGSVADNPSCKDLTIMPKHKLEMGLMASFVASVDQFTEFKKFVETKPKCQHECFQKVFPESVETLIGKLGDDIVKSDSQAVAIQAFTGAFRTCFPSPPRSAVLEAMKKITDDMKPNVPDKMPEIASSGTCPGTKGMGDKDAFMDFAEEHIGKAMDTVIGKSPDIKKFFQNVMLKCQRGCLGKNIEQAVNVNWDMGTLHDKEKVLASIEGSIKSCLPGVPYKDVADFVKAIGDEVESHSEETARLYQTGPILDQEAGKKSGMMTLIAVAGGACTLALGAFALGLRAGKLSQHRAQELRLVEMENPE